MNAAATDDATLEQWFSVVDREARRNRVIDRTIGATGSGPLTLPIRFFFKVFEIGPLATVKLTVGIVIGMIRQR